MSHINLEAWRGSWCLVTGASSGIGREFAQRLAAAGLNVVLVARRGDLLQELAQALSARHGVQALALPTDLSLPGAAHELREQVLGQGVRIRLLVNNAAIGRWGPFESSPVAAYEAMLQLNTLAMVALCHEFLPDLAAHPDSAVINVSSPAAYQPVPYMAVYAASKAFVHSFSQALHGEWGERGVVVQTLVPGPTATEFDAKAGAYDSALKGRGGTAEVVAESLARLAKGAPLAVSARGTIGQRLFAGLFPAGMVIRQVGKMFRPPR